MFGIGGLRWVSTEWFEKNLGRGWTILDVQPDVHDYFLAHIPRAVYLCEKTLRAPLKGMPAQFLEPEVIGRLFSRVGISASKPVLVYTARGGFKGWGDGLDQFMMAYTLLRMDHPEVYLMDGGLDKWLKEGTEISQEFPEVTPTNFLAGVNRSIFIELEELKSVKNNPETILLDARPTEFYTGEAGPWIRNGQYLAPSISPSQV